MSNDVGNESETINGQPIRSSYANGARPSQPAIKSNPNGVVRGPAAINYGQKGPPAAKSAHDHVSAARKNAGRPAAPTIDNSGYKPPPLASLGARISAHREQSKAPSMGTEAEQLAKLRKAMTM